MSSANRQTSARLRAAAYFAAAIAPAALVLLLGIALLQPPDWLAAGPPLVGGAEASTPSGRDSAAQVATSAANTMITLSGGLALASLWVFRMPRRPTRQTINRVLFCVAMGLTVAVVYCGLRFQLDLAYALSQDSDYPGALFRILHWQGGLLLVQTSFLAALGVDYFLHMDLRRDAI